MLDLLAPAIAEALQALSERVRRGTLVPVRAALEDGPEGAYVELALRLEVPADAPPPEPEPTTPERIPTTGKRVPQCPKCCSPAIVDAGAPSAGGPRELLCTTCNHSWRA